MPRRRASRTQPPIRSGRGVRRVPPTPGPTETRTETGSTPAVPTSSGCRFDPGEGLLVGRGLRPLDPFDARERPATRERQHVLGRRNCMKPSLSRTPSAFSSSRVAIANTSPRARTGGLSPCSGRVPSSTPPSRGKTPTRSIRGTRTRACSRSPGCRSRLGHAWTDRFSTRTWRPPAMRSNSAGGAF